MGRVVTGATGSRRYRVTYRAPGGHSFGAFGAPNAVHAMGRAIAKIAGMPTPADPKTTFNVGRVRGGTGATAIAEDAVMDLDLRRNAGDELEKLTARVRPTATSRSASASRRSESPAAEVAAAINP